MEGEGVEDEEAARDRELLEHQEAILRALESKVKGGEAREYVAFMEQMRNCVDSKELQLLFRTLSQHASYLAKYHAELEELLSMLFMFDWACDADVASAFESFLLSLVSAHGGFLEPSFQLLVQNLGPLDVDEPQEEDSIANEDIGTTEERKRNEETRNEYIHKAIRSILRVNPLGCSALLPVIIEHYPHRRESFRMQTTYLVEVLKIANYVPVLRDRIVAVVFDRLHCMDIEIDVEDLEPEQCKVSGETGHTDGNKAVSEGDDLEESVFEMEDGDEEEMKEDKTVSAAVLRVREFAEKMDALMIILMDYCDEQLSKSSRYGRVFFELLLNVFDGRVMRSKSSKFTQYLLFYVCRRRPEYVDNLLERLLQYALSTSVPTFVAQQAAAYLSSFLARARFVRPDAVQSTMEYLAQWVKNYHTREIPFVETHQRKNGTFDPRHHVQFFTLCQVFVYIVIFKGGELPTSTLQLINWVEISQGALNPFLYFPRPVVEEFINFAVAHKELLQYVFPASANVTLKSVEQLVNEVCTVRHSKQQDVLLKCANTKARMEVEFDLDVHYPFDPCLLRRMAERIEPLYQHWFSIKDAEHEEFENDSEEDDTEESGAEEEAREKEFSSKALLVDKSELPPAIRIPSVVLHQLKNGRKEEEEGEEEARNTFSHGPLWGMAYSNSSLSSNGSILPIDSLGPRTAVGTSIVVHGMHKTHNEADDCEMDMSVSPPPAIPGLEERFRAAVRESRDAMRGTSAESGSW